jgi:hypothetical protein
MFEDLKTYILRCLSNLCSQKYKIFEHDFLHVCGIYSWLHASIFFNFLKNSETWFFLKNEITNAHVHQIFLSSGQTRHSGSIFLHKSGTNEDVIMDLHKPSVKDKGNNRIVTKFYYLAEFMEESKILFYKKSSSITTIFIHALFVQLKTFYVIIIFLLHCWHDCHVCETSATIIHILLAEVNDQLCPVLS